MKSKLLLLALGVGAAGFAMAQTQASDATANDQTQRNADTTTTAPAPADQIQNGPSVQSSSNLATTPMQAEDDTVVKNLNQASFDNRKDALDQVDSRIGKAHRSALKVEVKNAFHKESGDMKAEYKAAKEEEKSARSDVKVRLKDAKDATADSWEANRTALAQAYQRYCQAVAKVDSFGRNQEANNPSSTSDENTPATPAPQSDQSAAPASSSTQPQQ